MKFSIVAAVCCMLVLSNLNAQKQPLNNFAGYDRLPGNSYVKYFKKGKSTTVADTGGALFVRLFFLTESDSVFIDINEEANTGSYPMRFDPYEYKGDFLYIMGQMHVGDSLKCFMSLDSLHKYFPDEFVFDEFHDHMKYLGMAIRVDSIIDREKVEKLRAEAAAQREAEYKQLLYDDSLQLNQYLTANNYPMSPNYKGIWYRTLKKGSGQSVKNGDEVQLSYKYSYPDGKVIVDSTLTYVIGDTDFVVGWQIGVANMTKGEKAMWIMPSALAYNDGHTLIFEIQLIDIKPNKK